MACRLQKCLLTLINLIISIYACTYIFLRWDPVGFPRLSKGSMAQKVKNPCFIGISGIYDHIFYVWYPSTVVR